MKKIDFVNFDPQVFPLRLYSDRQLLFSFGRNFTEKFAIKNNYKKIIIIARLSALDFYKKNFFKTSGNIFTEVKVSSINMYKKI